MHDKSYLCSVGGPLGRFWSLSSGETREMPGRSDSGRFPTLPARILEERVSTA